MSPSLRSTLHWGGSGLALAGVVFIALRLHSYWSDLNFSQVDIFAWCLIAVFALIYGSANLLLALAWWHLLRHLGAPTTPFGSVKIYGISQLAKYVPGNIFHLVGRQALGMAAEAEAGILAKSTIWELGSLAFAGVLFGWLTLPLLSPECPQAVAILLLLGSAAATTFLLRSVTGPRPAWAFIWQTLFLLASGTTFVALLHLIAGSEKITALDWSTIGGAYITAWLVGLVAPGAPAGVGIRETILLLLLKGLVAETDLLMIALLGRLVTVIGDLLFFVVTSFIPAKLCAFKENNV
jgi:hypothetical protein